MRAPRTIWTSFAIAVLLLGCSSSQDPGGPAGTNNDTDVVPPPPADTVLHDSLDGRSARTDSAQTLDTGQRVDTKETGPDTTAPPEDTTTPPEDSTAPPEDSTAPPEDSTAPPEDSTAPPEDSTAPPQDTSPPGPPQLSVNADAAVLESGDSMDAGQITVGAVSPLIILTIWNAGESALLIGDDLSLTGDAAFFLVFAPSATIAPGGSSTVGITYAPLTEGPATAQLTIGHNAPEPNPFVLNLEGTGLPPPVPTPLFVATVGCCTRYLSTDGVEWLTITDEAGPEPKPLDRIVWAEDRFILTGGVYSGAALRSRYATTTNGVILENSFEVNWDKPHAMAHAEGVTVVVHQNGHYSFSENKGLYWETATEEVSTGTSRSLAFGDAGFVGVEGHGSEPPALSSSRVSISLDGTTWSSTEEIEGRLLGDIVFGNGRYLATGSRYFAGGNSVFDCATSTDAVEWTPCPAEVTNYGAAPLFLNGEHLLINSSATGYRSVDGLEWSPFSWAGDRVPRSLTWGNGQYVGFRWVWNSHCELLYGADLEALEVLPMDGISQDECPQDSRNLAFGWGPPNFVPAEALAEPTMVVSAGGAELLSSDTISVPGAAVEDFSLQVIDIENTGAGVLQFAAPLVTLEGEDAAHFALVEDPAQSTLPEQSTRFVIQYQPEALGTHQITVTLQSNDPTSPVFQLTLSGQSVAPAEELPRFVTSSGCCERWWSNNGSEWTLASDDIPAEDAYNNSFRDFKVLSNTFVGIGGGGAQSRFAVSEDGVTWTYDQTYPWGWKGGGGTINGHLVAAGGNGSAAYSVDGGETWQESNTGTGHIRFVASSDTRIVALGDHSTQGSWTATTTDGETWDSAHLPDLEIRQVAAGNDIFVAAGSRDNQPPFGYAWSTDGLEWTVISALSPTASLSLLGFFDGQFYLRGTDSYLSSADGVNWETHPYALPNVLAYGKGLWVGATTEGTLHYGTDLNKLLPVADVNATVSRLVYGTRPAP